MNNASGHQHSLSHVQANNSYKIHFQGSNNHQQRDFKSQIVYKTGVIASVGSSSST